MKYEEVLFPEDIYKKHLAVINNIKFTPREIDIITCILHGKTVKGISDFLSLEGKSIGNRAIESHKKNIFYKIAGNSRESIINFIEKSDKYSLIMNHYSSLSIYKEFKKTLQKIALLSERPLEFSIIYLENDENINNFISKLQSHICLLGKTKTLKEEGMILSWLTKDELESQHLIYFISEKSAPPFKQDQNTVGVVENDFQEILTSVNKKKKKARAVILGPDAFNYHDIHTLFPMYRHIDPNAHDNYYFLFFEILEELLPKAELKEIIGKFKERYNNMQILSFNSSASFPTKNKATEEKNNIYNLNRYLSHKLFIPLGIILLPLLGYFAFSIFNGIANEINTYDQEILSTEEIDKTLASFVHNFSADNITKEHREKNHKLIKLVERIIDPFNNKYAKYFHNELLPPERLLNYLYSLQALAGYHLYNYHDGEKARKLLKYGQSLAEDYIKARSKLKLDFNKLEPQEVYIELSIIRDLPEIYTRIIYLLGRSYMYQKDKNDAIRYFELSSYLGNKTGVFEGYLSKISIEVIKEEVIKSFLDNKAYREAEKTLKESINSFIELKNDKGMYKLDYKPDYKEERMITPSLDGFRQLDCDEQLIKCYTWLINTTDNTELQESYLKEILNLVIDNKRSQGILSSLNGLPDKKKASFYNTLGNTLLTLYDKNIVFPSLKDFLNEQLNLNSSDDLETISSIYSLAASLSRNTEYTKADSYNGLIQVCKRQLKQIDLKAEEREKLTSKMMLFSKKRDEINKELKRENK